MSSVSTQRFSESVLPLNIQFPLPYLIPMKLFFLVYLVLILFADLGDSNNGRPWGINNATAA